MSPTATRPKSPPRRAARRPSRRVLGLVTLTAVAAAAALIWLGQREPERAALNLPTDGHTIGYAGAPVEVEEWGDFQ